MKKGEEISGKTTKEVRKACTFLEEDAMLLLDESIT